MAEIERFEDIKAWQKARMIDFEIYNFAENSELFYNDFALKDQIIRASGSIMNNIAEGFEREGTKEFILFSYYSKESCGEVSSQLYRTLDRGYIEKETFDKPHEQVDEIGKMLSGFSSYLKKSNIKGDKFKQ